MTPAMLSGEQYNRVGELYRILDPDTGDQSLQLPSESQESCEPSPNSQTGTPANRRLSPGTGGQSLEPRLDSRNRREFGQEPARLSAQGNVERSVDTLTAPLTHTIYRHATGSGSRGHSSRGTAVTTSEE